MKSTFNTKFFILCGFVVLAATSRFLPYIFGARPDSLLWNFSPIMALALFGGARFADKKLAYLVPLAAMIASDAIIGFHATIWAVYLSFAIAVAIGFWLKKHGGASRIIMGTLAGSIVFYIITNFAFWLMFMPLTGEMLVQSYIDAIPFFRNSLAGDLIYSGVLFGCYAMAERLVFAAKPQKQLINKSR